MQDTKKELKANHARLDEARRELASELEKLRASAKLNEDRLNAPEKRALFEIDCERTVNSRHEKTLEMTNSENKHAVEAHRAEVNAQQVQVANLRQTVGKLEGAIQAAHESQTIADRYMSESKAMLSNITRETAMLRAERDLLWTLSLQRTITI